MQWMTCGEFKQIRSCTEGIASIDPSDEQVKRYLRHAYDCPYCCEEISQELARDRMTGVAKEKPTQKVLNLARKAIAEGWVTEEEANL